MRASCLDLHAAYRCHHSGACCENWAVPAESQVVALVHARGLRRDGVIGPLFHPSTTTSGDWTWTVARDQRGDCVFFDRAAGRLCVIHQQAGAEALPAACRHFPRRVLHDTRGTLISLSHFCPTAAGLLLTGRAPSIVEARTPLCLPQRMEGLDASDALPPLVRPGLLSDMEGYDAWERASLAMLARDDLAYDACTDRIASATERVRQWRPGGCSMHDAVRQAFDETPVPVVARTSQRVAIERLASLAAGRAGDDLQPLENFDDVWNRRIGPRIAPFDRAMKNYLSARIFGNWIAYQGQGLRSIVEWLRSCTAMVHHELLRRVLRGEPLDERALVEAIRTADLLLLHVLDGAAFGRHVAAVEGSDPS